MYIDPSWCCLIATIIVILATFITRRLDVCVLSTFIFYGIAYINLRIYKKEKEKAERISIENNLKAESKLAYSSRPYKSYVFDREMYTMPTPPPANSWDGYPCWTPGSGHIKPGEIGNTEYGVLRNWLIPDSTGTKWILSQEGLDGDRFRKGPLGVDDGIIDISLGYHNPSEARKKTINDRIEYYKLEKKFIEEHGAFTGKCPFCLSVVFSGKCFRCNTRFIKSFYTGPYEELRHKRLVAQAEKEINNFRQAKENTKNKYYKNVMIRWTCPYCGNKITDSLVCDECGTVVICLEKHKREYYNLDGDK